MPVFLAWYDFLVNAIVGSISSAIAWVLNETLPEIMEYAVIPVMDILYQLTMQMRSVVYYLLLTGLLSIVDIMQKGFDVLLGVETVSYTQNGVTVEDSLMNILFGYANVKYVFWGITLIALILTIVFTIMAVVKSMGDLGGENKKTVTRALGSGGKAALSFLLVPFFVLVGINLSGVVLSAINAAFAVPMGDGETAKTPSVATILFLTVTLDATKIPNEPVFSQSIFFLQHEDGSSLTAKELAAIEKRKNLRPSFDDSTRLPYYNGTKSFMDYKTVVKDFDLSRVDYITGFLAGGFILVIFVLCLVTFVRRIFEVLLLYLVAPLFASTMPLDDGEKFGRWREELIGKLVTGYGTLIGMRVFLMLVPLIMSKDLNLAKSFNVGTANGMAIDYFMKLILLVGGMFAIYKSNSLFAQIASSGTTAAAAEQENAATALMLSTSIARNSLKAGKFAVKAGKFVGKGADKAYGVGKKVTKAGIARTKQWHQRQVSIGRHNRQLAKYKDYKIPLQRGPVDSFNAGDKKDVISGEIGSKAGTPILTLDGKQSENYVNRARLNQESVSFIDSSTTSATVRGETGSSEADDLFLGGYMLDCEYSHELPPARLSSAAQTEHMAHQEDQKFSGGAVLPESISFSDKATPQSDDAVVVGFTKPDYQPDDGSYLNFEIPVTSNEFAPPSTPPIITQGDIPVVDFIEMQSGLHQPPDRPPPPPPLHRPPDRPPPEPPPLHRPPDRPPPQPPPLHRPPDRPPPPPPVRRKDSE